MYNTRLPRRGFLAGTLGLALFGAAACGNSSNTSTGSAASTSGTATAAATTGREGTPSLQSLTSEVKGKFKQYTYKDSKTGQSLPYNLYVPADYDAAKSYPLVLYIADSSLVGQDVTVPLSQYGALIWASASEQAKHESIVLVPEYPSVIIDDHGSYTTNEYVEMTPRLLSSVASKYSVDPERIYGTGQSMGCMTVMYLAAKHPDLFAAELFVSGQWEISQLTNLAKEKFFYIAAGGDDKASVGQTEVQKMLKSAGVSYQAETWDATWSEAQFSAAAKELFAAGDSINFATFKTGTVLEVSGASSSAMAGEHMASFEPAYEITSLRDWLFEQSA
ncbi:alpha/beta hydrolase-fold protein [Streptomyces fulvoviolaceus]|uniref:carboxylesterase family protein n=1 Tax=Streptomyces fulvoviolaceus TaxID=285535 RepID=UPI0004CB3202|nr:alpha/beta hydrolase-fold protein [Streptomyces fulvoviolaceus]